MALSTRSLRIAARAGLAAGGAAAALLLAACGSSTSNHAGGSGAGGGSSPTAGSPSASSAPATVGTARTATGIYLIDQSGRTLYLFTPDKPTASACTGSCATAWPPLTVTGTPTAGGIAKTSLLGTIMRPDGRTQVTYGGHPLYYFSRDLKPGDIMGQGLNKTWYIVGPFGNVMQRPVGPSGGPSA
jgi:predicted lipoprotein with Yx(FWY)xxD motif